MYHLASSNAAHRKGMAVPVRVAWSDGLCKADIALLNQITLTS